jgi:hypothetical protein
MGLLSRWLGTDTARDLVTDLAEDYRIETEQAAHLRQHAERARYPQFATALCRLAEIEERHASWLRDQLIALGAAVPSVEPAPIPGRSQWARVVATQTAAYAKLQRLIEQIGHWDPDEPEVVALLQRIEDEDRAQLSVYDGIIMRSDPQALD